MSEFRLVRTSRTWLRGSARMPASWRRDFSLARRLRASARPRVAFGECGDETATRCNRTENKNRSRDCGRIERIRRAAALCLPRNVEALRREYSRDDAALP